MKDYSAILSPENVEKVVLAGGLVILSQAQVNTPVKTGLLRNSLSVKTLNNHQGQNSMAGNTATAEQMVSKPENYYEAHVGTNVEYSVDVEYGKRDKPTRRANPYLRPALQTKRKDAITVMEKVISNYIKENINGNN